MAGAEALGAEYVLHEEIGRGALAVVRRATSRFGGPPLAAKLLRPEYAGDRRIRELFIREEAALRDLDHPSIVGIRDLVVERGRLALLMELVPGPDLRRHLAARGGRLPLGEATAIAAQTAAALAAAHAVGVVHLDLKPENILVAAADPVQIKITDFGVAALLLDADPAVVGGTPGYEAPELQRGGVATAAADIFALGVVTRELLGGEVPAPLAAMVDSCLDPNPRNRPSARALAAQLRELQNAPPAAASPAGVADSAAVADAAAMADSAAMAYSAGRETRLRNGGVPPAGPVAPVAAQPAARAPWRRGPLITLAAGAVVAAVLVAMTANAAATQQRAAEREQLVLPTAQQQATTSAAAPPATLPPTENLGRSAPADRTRATFAGKVGGGGGTLAASLRDGVAIAYLCDGDKVEAWLKGTAANGTLTLTGKNGAKITGTFDQNRAAGKVTVLGRTHTFAIKVAKKPSGLYRLTAQVRNAEVRGSWIVLPDGSQVGVLLNGATPGPAPALDVPGRSTTIDGTRLTASTIDVDSGEGF